MPNEIHIYKCPVCGFGGLDEPPYDEDGCASFNICPCCGTEFGNDDFRSSHEQLRADWFAKGMPWWSKGGPPEGWDPRRQLSEAGLEDVPG